MDHVPGLDLPAAYGALLQRAVDHFRDDRRVFGLIPGGSLAHGVADSCSDVDLYIVARDEPFDAEFEERASVALAPVEAIALYDALRAEISLFRDLGEHLFEPLGSTCDEAPGEEIKDEMVRRWNARKA
jgi:hypothetical protein